MPAYADSRAQIRSGDLLAWSGRSVGARLIRHWTGSEITHIGLAWRAGGRLFTLEALPGIGVQMRLLSHALPCWWLPVALVHEVERTLGAPRTWLNKERAHA